MSDLTVKETNLHSKIVELKLETLPMFQYGMTCIYQTFKFLEAQQYIIHKKITIWNSTALLLVPFEKR